MSEINVSPQEISDEVRAIDPRLWELAATRVALRKTQELLAGQEPADDADA